MANSIISNRSITATLKGVELQHVRLGDAYRPSFAEATDVAQWSLVAVAKSGTPAFDQMLDLKEAGLDVQQDGESLILKLKQYEKTAKGKKNSVSVFDGNFEEMSLEDRRTIGNGSQGHVVFYFYAYANTHGVGYTTRLTDVVVTDKVDYTPETPQERMKRLFG